jgi:hypothetical protein
VRCPVPWSMRVASQASASPPQCRFPARLLELCAPRFPWPCILWIRMYPHYPVCWRCPSRPRVLWVASVLSGSVVIRLLLVSCFPCDCLHQMGHLSRVSHRPVASPLVLLPPPVPMGQYVKFAEGGPLSFCGGTRHAGVQPHCNPNKLLAGPHV